METRQDRAVGIIPVHKNAEGVFLFCIVQHADGHWGFPKGHVEAGESDEQAARRELREETGIANADIIPNVLLSEQYSFERDGAQYQKTVHYYIGRVDSPGVATLEQFKSEIFEVRWLPYEEARASITFDESRRLLDQVYPTLHPNTSF